MKHLSSLLWQSIQRAGLEKEVAAALVLEEFKKILEKKFGKKILKKVKILHFKNNILSLSALSSVVAQEIKLNEKKLLREVNKKFKKNLIERIRFFSR